MVMTLYNYKSVFEILNCCSLAVSIGNSEWVNNRVVLATIYIKTDAAEQELSTILLHSVAYLIHNAMRPPTVWFGVFDANSSMSQRWEEEMRWRGLVILLLPNSTFPDFYLFNPNWHWFKWLHLKQFITCWSHSGATNSFIQLFFHICHGTPQHCKQTLMSKIYGIPF